MNKTITTTKKMNLRMLALAIGFLALVGVAYVSLQNISEVSAQASTFTSRFCIDIDSDDSNARQNCMDNNMGGGDVVVEEVVSGPIAPGGFEAEVSTAGWTAVPGYHTAYLCTDAKPPLPGDVDELDEYLGDDGYPGSGNCMEYVFMVGGTCADGIDNTADVPIPLIDADDPSCYTTPGDTTSGYEPTYDEVPVPPPPSADLSDIVPSNLIHLPAGTIDNGASINFEGDVTNIGLGGTADIGAPFQTTPLRTEAQAIDIDGNTAYIGGDAGFSIVDITDPAALVQLSRRDDTTVPAIPFSAAGVRFKQIGLSKYVFISNFNEGLRILNVDDPVNPVLVSTVPIVGELWDTEISSSNQYAYVGGLSGFNTVDISNLSAPTVQATIPIPGSVVNDLTINGNYAYLAGRDGGVQVVSITDPLNPVLVGSYTTGFGSDAWAYDIRYDSGYLYVVSLAPTGIAANSKVIVLDVSGDPTNPTLVTSVPIPPGGGAGARTISISGSRAFVGARAAGMYVLDISDPATAHVVTFYDTDDTWDAFEVETTAAHAFLTLGDTSASDAPDIMVYEINAEFMSRFCVDLNSDISPDPDPIGNCVASNFVAGDFELIPLDKNTGPLASGASEIETSDVWNAVIGGNHTVYLCTDVNNIINEDNETNNCTSYNFTVNALPPPPTVSFTVNDSPEVDTFPPGSSVSIYAGGNVLLEWGVTGDASGGCVASGGWSGSKVVGPTSEVVNNVTVNSTYTLTCTGPGGSTAESVDVVLLPQPNLQPSFPISLAPSGGWDRDTGFYDDAYITYRVINNGTDDAGPFEIKLDSDFRSNVPPAPAPTVTYTVYENSDPSLLPLGLAQSSFDDFTTALNDGSGVPPGDWSVLIDVDHNNLVPNEISETDNDRTVEGNFGNGNWIKAPDPSVNLTIDPGFVRYDEKATLTWTMDGCYPMTCTIYGPEGPLTTFDPDSYACSNASPTITDTVLTNPIQTKTEFLMECVENISGYDQSFSDTAVVQTVGTIEEI